MGGDTGDRRGGNVLHWPHHPRMGGEHCAFPGGIRFDVQVGSSPHGRGTRDIVNPRASADRTSPPGNTLLRSANWPMYGSSPHGRGTPRLQVAQRSRCGQLRIIPAWAGNTIPLWPDRIPERRGSSPHGRGTQVIADPSAAVRRIIPAWAGNTVEPTAVTRKWPSVRIIPAWAGNTTTCWYGALQPGRTPDHPRMGGEHCRSDRA